ncbi:PGF-pre-PGF domain-containing protein [Methanohalophilus profundi]|uniref:PGF-pre-PGF domain-containing protein n=1 Tax=Methanohalophilus profundi TaxID=2138083 RepID=UPI00101E1F56|nr:PGF-pre-PGF domain-containing protein [Methanohalophilus profundi]
MINKRTLILLCTCMLLAVSMAAADDTTPSLPETFYGTVTVAGESATDGTVVSAWIDGNEVFSQETIDGKYGYSEGFNVYGDEGDTITFKVGGTEAATNSLGQDGEPTDLDFSVDSVSDDGDDSEESTGDSSSGGGSSDSDTSSSSSSGGGGGGGSTGEEYENIASTDAQTRTVTAGATASYEFDGEDNDVTFVQFRGTTNSGQIKVLIEVLKDTSALVDEDAPGDVYQNVNIWVGNAAFDDDNMEDPVVGFRVSKDWMSDNGVDPASIALFHHDDGWEQLETTQTDEDGDYFYFEAETTRFSPFAISTVESSAIQTQDTTGDTQADNTDESTDAQQEDSTGSDDDSTGVPSMSIIGIIGLIALVGIGAAYSMKKKNS